MRVKWMKKRFTFMVIPDANNSVVRLRVPGLILYLIPLVLLLLVTLTLSMYVIQMRSQTVAKQLENQMKEYQFAVSGKDETITQLQNELIHLSQQAQAVQTRIGEIQKLENDVKSITGSGSKDGSAASGTPNPAATDGIGGEAIPVTSENISSLVAEARTQYTNLGEETGKLFESLSELKRKALEIQRQLRMTPTIWPVDSQTVTSRFGYRSDPFTKRWSFHNGLDIGGNLNDSVYATAEGVIQSTGSDSTHGNHIIIKHANGIRTWYMHLNKISVKEGQTVAKGQQIGLMGNTGRSTGVHLHYSVLKNGDSVDPKPYLKASRKEEK